MRRVLLVAAFLALVLAPAALATGTMSGSGNGNPLQSPLRPGKPHLTKAQATADFLAEQKVQDWLARYPSKGRVTDASFDKKTDSWTIKVWWGAAGEIATGTVLDSTGLVSEAWTGPQV